VGIDLLNFDLLVSFLLLDFASLRHRLWGVGNLVLSRASSWYDESRLACEEALGIVTLSADGWVDRPLLVFSVLDCDALGCRLPHLCCEGELLSGRGIQLHTLSHECQLELIASFDDAWYFAVSDIWVCLAGVEGDLKVEVGVRVDVPALWADRKVLAVLLRLPLVVGLDVSEVGQLEALCEPAAFDHASEGNDLVHELQLDAMGDTVERNQLSWLVWLDHQLNVEVEVWKACLRVESYLHGHDFPWFQGHLTVGCEGHVALLELCCIAWPQLEGDWLLAPVDERHRLCDVATHRYDSKVEEGLVRILQLEL
jgi:hypothetical protein